MRLEAIGPHGGGINLVGQQHLRADLAAVTRQQTQQLALQEKRSELTPGRHRVILTPAAVADLLIYLTWSAGARDAIEGPGLARPGGGTRLGSASLDAPLRLFADPGYEGLSTASHVCNAQRRTRV